MVNFDNETTVSTPAGDVVKILILQRRNDFIESVEAYNKQTASGIQSDTSVVKSRLLSLYLEIHGALERNLNEGLIEELKLLMNNKEYGDLIRAFVIINRWLDKAKLIRIDTHKQYDRRNVEEENKNYKL